MLIRLVKLILAMIGILIIGILLIFSVSILRLKHQEKIYQERKKITDKYPVEVVNYLEKKYNKKFTVKDVCPQGSGSPIPGATAGYLPFIYDMYDNEDNCPFKVYLYPKSLDDLEIKKIEDNYCWKYLRNQVKSYFEQGLDKLLPAEYKLVYLINPDIMIDDYIKPDAPMSTYFKKSKSKVAIILYVYTPPEEEKVKYKLTEKELYSILDDFYKNNGGNMNLRFVYVQTETYEDYESINIDELESERFTSHIVTFDARREKNAEIIININ